MKITFEGNTILEIIEDMERVHAAFRRAPQPKSIPDYIVEGPGPQAKAPVDKPVGKPGKTRTPKQLENDERLRQAAKLKAETKAAQRRLDTAAEQYKKETTPDPMPTPPPPATAESLGLAPDEVVKLRVKVTEELQAAFANGFQKEVFELLSRFGNGAKSFRELPPEAFVPIREAIDNGALT